MKKSGVPVLLGIIFLVLTGVQGIPIMKNRRCLCIEINQEKIQSQSLIDLQQFAPSPSCEKTEIIATLKNGDQTCLNPDLPDVKKLMKDWEKQVSQKKKQKKGRKHQKIKKDEKVRKSERPHQKKTT
ncbi:C-X-C motif chemokine 9 [Trichechus manatus latirostris]|uniref:C-X-C motif chemokine n=1 Tax=Trichechus manatus latirostris TaxID=127582 RepID=A0A2Y9DXY6_TRIMA|nr:C-X-C motif chemokine 9 [Trichechus manatus latirostris]